MNEYDPVILNTTFNCNNNRVALFPYNISLLATNPFPYLCTYAREKKHQFEQVAEEVKFEKG